MEYEIIRGLLCGVCMMLGFAGPIVSFSKVKKREEFREVAGNGQKWSLNGLLLVSRVLLSADTPLGAKRKKLAKIGLLHFAVSIFGVFGSPFLVIIALNAF